MIEENNRPPTQLSGAEGTSTQETVEVVDQLEPEDSADLKRENQEMRAVNLDKETLTDATSTDTFQIVESLEETPYDADDRSKTIELSKYEIWQTHLEKTVLFKNAEVDEDELPQTPDEKFSDWVSNILEKALAREAIRPETALVMKDYVEMLITLATSIRTDTIIETQSDDSGPVVKIEDFTLRLGKAIGYYDVLVHSGLGSDAKFLLNFVLAMRDTQHLASYRKLFDKQEALEEIKTQESDIYLDQTFNAKDVEHWKILSDDTRFFKTDGSELTSYEITPPRVADEWVEWFTNLLIVPAMRVSNLGEQSSEVLQFRTLESLGYAINEWYKVVKDTPELRKVRSHRDLEEMEPLKVLADSREKYQEIEKYFKEATENGVGGDAKFVIYSFLYGNADANSLVPYIDLLRESNN